MLTSPRLTLLAQVMARAGWEIAYADLDLTGDTARAEIKLVRTDGRWLWAKADALGRCSVERFQRRQWLGLNPDGTGRRPLSPQIEDSFLGRDSCSGPRAMLRTVTAYLTGNAMRPIELPEMRAAWAAVMGAPLRLGVDRAQEESHP